MSAGDNRSRVFNGIPIFPTKIGIDHLRQVIMPQSWVSAPAASSHQLREEGAGRIDSRLFPETRWA
jgi:hypothetical protein